MEIFNLHKRAIHNPSEFLNEKVTNKPPVVYSRSRRLPVLIKDTSNYKDRTPKIVLNNGGASLMQSTEYVDMLQGGTPDKQVASVVTSMNRSPGMMLSFSNPEDMLVYENDASYDVAGSLDALRASWHSIGVDTTDKYYGVDDLVAWECELPIPEKTDIVPYVITPQLMAKYQPDFINGALAGVASGTKDGVQDLWEAKGVPVPPSLVYDVDQALINKDKIAGLQRTSNGYVISITAGSAGFGTTFVGKGQLELELQRYQKEFSGQRLRIQPYIPHKITVGVLGQIDYTGGSVITTSIQRLSDGGGHFGNYWDQDMMEYLENSSEGFRHISEQALKALEKAGVMGAVSLDMLLNNTNVIEANIRAGTSWPLLRMKDGHIGNNPVHSILTNRKVSLGNHQINESDLWERVNNKTVPGRTHVHGFHYEHAKNRVGLAFLGTEGVSLAELLRLEYETLEGLKSGF